MSSYDPDIIRKHADKLYLDAKRAPLLYGFAGGIVGSTVGLGLGLGLESWGAGLTLGVLLAVLAGWVGFSAGRSVASRMRLEAQSALCQVEIAKQLEQLARRG